MNEIPGYHETLKVTIQGEVEILPRPFVSVYIYVGIQCRPWLCYCIFFIFVGNNEYTEMTLEQLPVEFV